jgi:hypothetical protein
VRYDMNQSMMMLGSFSNASVRLVVRGSRRKGMCHNGDRWGNTLVGGSRFRHKQAVVFFSSSATAISFRKKIRWTEQHKPTKLPLMYVILEQKACLPKLINFDVCCLSDMKVSSEIWIPSN